MSLRLTPEKRRGSTGGGGRYHEREDAHAPAGCGNRNAEALRDLGNDPDDAHFGVDDAEDAEREDADQKVFVEDFAGHEKNVERKRKTKRLPKFEKSTEDSLQ